MDINIEQIRALADLAVEKNLSEITVEDGEQSVTLKLPSANITVQAAPTYAPQPQAAAPVNPAATAPTAPKAVATPTTSDEQHYKVTSPMVGTFYAAPSPDSAPFVKVGASVAKGQTLCIIEAMKLMNELESEVSGKVVKLLVENGQPVEFGQPILLIDTSAG